MDKYEYNLKLDEIKKLVTSGNYEEAVKVADTVEWKRVRNTRTLCMVSEIYEANGRLEDSKEILLRAYRRSQMTRTILFRLTEVAIKMKEFDEAVEYYSEFVNAAPNDTSRYILKYEIYKGRGSSLEDQIAILEEYKEAEYTEQWGYELAKLYYQAGEKQKCIESCDDLVLWFRQGKYVIKALELKRSLTELTPMQQTIYDHRDENLMPIKERVEAAVPELEKIIVDKMPSNETDAITENIISETQKELAQAVSQHTAAAEQETPEQQDQSWRYSTGGTTRVMPADAVRNNLQTDAPAAASAGAAEAVPQEPEAPDQAFDAQQLQKELAESMREIISGIHPAETEAEIVEPKNDMSFFRDRAGNVPVQEPKESIDDILVSMSGADETASTEEKEPEREIPEMPDLQVENEQPKEAVQPSGEERIPAPQAAAQDPGMAASGFAALEAQAAKMRAEAEQAAGLNERLAAHAGVNAAAEKKVEMPGTTAPDMASGTLENSQTEKKTAAQPQVPVKKPEQAAREQRIQSVQQSQAGQPVMSQPAQGQQQAAAGVPQQSSADQKAARVSQAQGVIRMERAGRNTEAAATQQNPYQQAAYRPNQSLTLSQQQLFSYFSTIQGLQEQIACAMKETLNKLQKDKTSRSGNLVITGDPGSGRTTLGIRFAKALCQERGNSAARVAKIYAEDFNKKDIASTVAKIAGGTLIIEEAGDLSEESIAQLSKAMEFRTDGLLVILEDEKSYLKELFDKNPTFAEKFTSEISIPIMTNDELVTFGKIYAYDEDYRIDDSAMVALYNRIGEMQTPEHPVCIADVRDIVDDAISRSERTGIRKLGRILSHKRYDEDDRVILYEKDFK
ncbi:hypothetical protein DXA57_08545 [Blautia sp. OF03-15BH]|uniref:hypothetical protein n=1 Tax=Blautia sp. OF03-15BH TaxID=2292287 RepID=UPI000E52B3B0|nr:hypothetical protein [Blautia sp. OF03-15BH]RGY01069.1 hypothetical protein DXA57_08545 [Blautia sp. OF03-15BH]